MNESEKTFEEFIESYLISEEGGWAKATEAGLRSEESRGMNLDIVTLTDFVKSTQSMAWRRFERMCTINPVRQFYKSFENAVTQDGLISVLRYGFKHRGINFRVCYFKPESELNDLAVENYKKNVCQCIRQWHYSEQNTNSIDMLLALNGIPVIAIELKNQLTGQSVDDAKKQWAYNRNPKEPVFGFNKRILAYFACDLYDVYMTTRLDGPGHNYLIQHSAGSGKSNSIAWTAYRMASLHDSNNEAVYNSVIVVTDRRVLDQQLQATISSFDHTLGSVETIDDKKSSKDLLNAINKGKRVIVTTLQKFPVIYEQVQSAVGKHYAIIVDEAHSSQTGQSAMKLKAALADVSDALEEYAELEQKAVDEIEAKDILVQDMLSQGKHRNLSFFAFTATPKGKTLEIFGEPQPDGSFHPFHIYSMRQAIEEGFILDVLANYIPPIRCAIRLQRTYRTTRMFRHPKLCAPFAAMGNCTRIISHRKRPSSWKPSAMLPSTKSAASER